MLNWNSIDFVYLYDGTFDGLMTIVFDCFVNKSLPSAVYNENTYQVNLVDKFIFIETDIEKSKRIVDGILKNISFDVFYSAYTAFLSNSDTKEINILKYLCDGFITGPQINNMLSIPYVFEISALRRRVWLEAHRMKGLLRFISIQDNFFYATLHLDNDVIEQIGKHFVNRLPNENFIIIDKNRNKAFLYNTKEYNLLDVSCLDIPKISEEEKLYQDLWKTFFKTIAIKERTNPKLQRAYMPKRYWQDLIEIE